MALKIHNRAGAAAVVGVFDCRHDPAGGALAPLVFDPTELVGGRSRRAYFSGLTQGIYRSDSAGAAWQLVSSSHPDSRLGVHRGTGRLYVGNTAGFFTSDTRGASFDQRRSGAVGGIATPAAGVVYVTEGAPSSARATAAYRGRRFPPPASRSGKANG